MKLIPSSAEILPQENIMQHIELCGRVCYKSEDKITPNSSEKFVKGLIKSGHTSVLEHGTVYLTSEQGTYDHMLLYDFFARNPYSVVIAVDDKLYITTNYRVIVENHKEKWLKYITSPSEWHAKRVTVRFTCDRAVANEFVRHRVFSFSQESTRYCNYSKDKFDNELTFICPYWIDVFSSHIKGIPELIFLNQLNSAEKTYMRLLDEGLYPQQARQVLPLALKTELIMTGTISQWKSFFLLRCANNVHPDARILAETVFNEFVARKYISKP